MKKETSESTRPKIRIEIASDIGWTRVFLDDVEVKGLVNVCVEHKVGNFPSVVLYLLPEDIEIAGDFTGDVKKIIDEVVT